MEETIEFIVKNLADHPEDVKITRTDEKDFVTFKIDVNKEDMGKVIGKNGKVATALRTIARALARHENKHVNIKIGD